MKSYPAYTRENATDLLQRYGINPTRQRIGVVQVLFSKLQHLSADQILTEVNARHLYASKATVYNALKLFVAKGMVREVLVDPSKTFYDPNTEGHHHFYDVVSGQLTDIAADKITISSLPALPTGMVSEGIDVVVRVRPAS